MSTLALGSLAAGLVASGCTSEFSSCRERRDCAASASDAGSGRGGQTGQGATGGSMGAVGGMGTSGGVGGAVGDPPDAASPTGGNAGAPDASTDDAAVRDATTMFPEASRPDASGVTDAAGGADSADVREASPPLVCTAPAADCNEDAKDGCEVDLDSDPAHCGICDNACDTTNVADSTCVAGVCAPACAPGFADCVTATPLAPGDGCETRIDDDPDNCGACGNACDTSRVATPLCVAGTCAPTCTTGWGDCISAAVGEAGDGCEQDLTLDTSCGACGKSCLGGTCSALRCSAVQLVSWGGVIWSDLVVHDGTLYFSASEGTPLSTPNHVYQRSVVTSETAVTTFLESTQTFRMAADATHLYLLAGPGTVAAELSSGTAVTVGDRPQSVSNAHRITLDGRYAYVTDGLELWRVDTTGALSPSQRGTLSNTATDLLVVDELVWTAQGSVATVPVIGGAESTVPNVSAKQLAWDGTYVYLADTGILKRVTPSGGTPQTLNVFTGSPNDMALVADAAIILTSGGLYRVPFDGSTVVQLSDVGGSGGVVVDGGVVYWNTSEVVMKLVL